MNKKNYLRVGLENLKEYNDNKVIMEHVCKSPKLNAEALWDKDSIEEILFYQEKALLALKELKTRIDNVNARFDDQDKSEMDEVKALFECCK